MSTVSVQQHSLPSADPASPEGFHWYTYCTLDGVPFGLGPTPQAAAASVEHDLRLCYMEPPEDGDTEGAIRREAAYALNGCLIGGFAPDELNAFTVWARLTNRGVDARSLTVWRTAFPLPKGDADPLAEVVKAAEEKRAQLEARLEARRRAAQAVESASAHAGVRV